MFDLYRQHEEAGEPGPIPSRKSKKSKIPKKPRKQYPEGTILSAKHGGREIPVGTFTAGLTLWVVDAKGRRQRRFPTSPSTHASWREYNASPWTRRFKDAVREDIESSPCSAEISM